MNFVALGAESLAELSAEARAERMSHELAQVDRYLPLGTVVEQRQRAMAWTGDEFDTAYDHLMWDIIGNPYEMFGPRRWERTSSGEWLQYGHHLFTGLSDDGEILSVSGATTSRYMSRPEGYQVHTLQIAKSETTAWTVHDVELSPPSGTYDVRLHIGRLVLEDSGDQEEVTVSFRNPSRSDASITEGEHKTYYNRDTLKNLYVIVQAFNAKYGIVETLYRPDLEPVVMLPVADPVPLVAKAEFVAAA